MQIVKYDAACQAIAECKRIDEVKDWSDKAAAIEAYGRMSKNYDIERDAAEIRVRAQRKMGELIIEMDKSKGGRPAEKPVLGVDRFSAVTLTDMGISRNQSSQAQAIARIPEPEFEQTLSEHREEQKKVTGRMLSKLAKQAAAVELPPAPPPPDEDHQYAILRNAWNDSMPSVKARFLADVQQENWTLTPVSTPAPTPLANAWACYAIAYQERYGVEPVRNAAVNGQLTNLIKRIGGIEAPHVARFYVASNAAFYVKAGHSVAMLLKDCEKLRTEWATNSRMTETRARQGDRTEANGQVFRDLLEESNG